MDFALWIKALDKHKNHLQNWQSPWGRGFPGWHLECSIMSQKLLDKQFDIHCGGIDLIPIHHVNEIAQSKALYGLIPARFWVHKEYLQIKGAKMAKSIGNFITLDDLKKSGYSPEIFKLFVLSSHYRSKLQFSEKALDQAQSNLKTIRNFLVNCQKHKAPGIKDQTVHKFWQNFVSALNDDLNTPKSLAEIFDLIKTVEKQNYKVDCGLILEKFKKIQDIFGIILVQSSQKPKISDEIQKLLDERLTAREKKDYKKSDQIRNQLLKKGINLQDLPNGKQEIIYD
jgi:cysteinyl-tRNA synthetase